MPRPAAALGLVALVGIIVMACSPSAVASLLPSEPGPLVTVTTRGGECVDGPCGSIIEIARDGTVTEVQPRSIDIGTVPADLTTALDDAIKATDFAAIRARPFTGECPVNFDGQEVIYEFGAPTGIERVASCETEVDPDHPLFVAVREAFAARGAA